jgi:hypothetical protein
MAPIKVTLKLEGDTITTDPPKVVVPPGGTLVWISHEGDFVVSIDDPVVDGKRFSGLKGKESGEAKVRADAPRGKHVVCTASIGGKSSKAYGFDIQP